MREVGEIARLKSLSSCPGIQVLNLFLALLLSSFGASNLSMARDPDDETNKLTEAFSRIGRFKRFIIRSIVRGLVFLRDKIVGCFRTQISFRRGECTACQRNGGRKKALLLSMTISFLPPPFHSHTFSLGELRHDVFIFIFRPFLIPPCHIATPFPLNLSSPRWNFNECSPRPPVS